MPTKVEGSKSAHIGGGLGGLLGIAAKTFLLDPFLRDRENEAGLAQQRKELELGQEFEVNKENRANIREDNLLAGESEGYGALIKMMGGKLPKQSPVGIADTGQRMELGPPEIPDAEAEVGAVSKALDIPMQGVAPQKIHPEAGQEYLEHLFAVKEEEAEGPKPPKNPFDASLRKANKAAVAAGRPKASMDEVFSVFHSEEEKLAAGKEKVRLHEKGERPRMETLPAEAKNSFEASEKVITLLEQMDSYYRGGAKEGVGMFRGTETLSRGMRWVGAGAPFEAQFRAAAGELTSRIVKMFSGAQSSDPERKHIALTLPQANEVGTADYEAKWARAYEAAKYLRRRQSIAYAMSKNEFAKRLDDGTLDDYITKRAGRPSWLTEVMNRPIGEKKTFPNGAVGIWDGTGYEAQE